MSKNRQLMRLAVTFIVVMAFIVWRVVAVSFTAMVAMMFIMIVVVASFILFGFRVTVRNRAMGQ